MSCQWLAISGNKRDFLRGSSSSRSERGSSTGYCIGRQRTNAAIVKMSWSRRHIRKKTEKQAEQTERQSRITTTLMVMREPQTISWRQLGAQGQGSHSAQGQAAGRHGHMKHCARQLLLLGRHCVVQCDRRDLPQASLKLSTPLRRSLPTRRRPYSSVNATHRRSSSSAGTLPTQCMTRQNSWCNRTV
jgi:hypothetical protein